MSWLSSVQDWFANAAKGNGVVIALVLARRLGRDRDRGRRSTGGAKQFLILAVVLNLLYWVVGQGFGGILQGGATDPNAGLLFILLATPVHAGALRAAVEEHRHRSPRARELAVSG